MCGSISTRGRKKTARGRYSMKEDKVEGDARHVGLDVSYAAEAALQIRAFLFLPERKRSDGLTMPQRDDFDFKALGSACLA